MTDSKTDAQLVFLQAQIDGLKHMLVEAVTCVVYLHGKQGLGPYRQFAAAIERRKGQAKYLVDQDMPPDLVSASLKGYDYVLDYLAEKFTTERQA